MSAVDRPGRPDRPREPSRPVDVPDGLGRFGDRPDGIVERLGDSVDRVGRLGDPVDGHDRPDTRVVAARRSGASVDGSERLTHRFDGIGRRSVLTAMTALLGGAATLTLDEPLARAFGDEGAFHPRILLTGTAKWEAGGRRSGPGRWSYELARRTSAPAKMAPATVRADSGSLLAEPFVIWTGDGPVASLSNREIEVMRKFITSGGTMLVDDAAPETGSFGREARRELARVLPDAVVTTLPDTHVIFHSFYRLKRALGRVEGPRTLDAISRGGNAQVIFSAHDLLGALARDLSGPSFSVSPGGETQRELATRLAVNLAMYVLCSTYKDDQVHAPALMKRSLMDR